MDVQEEVDPEPGQDRSGLLSEDHVLFSFTSGNAIAEGSIVVITPHATVETVGFGLYARMTKYHVERKIMTLVYEGSRREDYDTYVNTVLQVGSTITFSDGSTWTMISVSIMAWCGVGCQGMNLSIICRTRPKSRAESLSRFGE